MLTILSKFLFLNTFKHLTQPNFSSPSLNSSWEIGQISEFHLIYHHCHFDKYCLKNSFVMLCSFYIFENKMIKKSIVIIYNKKNEINLYILLNKKMEYELLPTQPKKRVIGDKYLYENSIVIWDGKRLRCLHERRRERCIECEGSQICIHKKNKYTCVECGGKQICEHKKIKKYCISCKGTHICPHMKRKYECKICYQKLYCEHNKKRTFCLSCSGNSRCSHRRIKKNCKICKEESIKWNNMFSNFSIDTNYTHYD